MSIPVLNNIDHLHIYTKNRAKATQWYQETLGFNVDSKYDEWASQDGPLVMTNPQGNIHLAFFERVDFSPSSIIAFGTDSDGFFEWKKYLEKSGLLTAYKDHTLSWSLYFSDSDGNGLEITTEDYEAVKQRI